MITIKINVTKYRIPTEWMDVTYSQYVSLLSTPNTLPAYIAIFTGIDQKKIESSELKNLETIAIALSFITIPPKIEPKPTRLVGPYVVPTDVTLQSLGQFEDLRGVLQRLPQKKETIEENQLVADLYLEACAIYCQKIKHGSYDYSKVSELKEELKSYSCIEVIQTGGFFLFKLVNLSTPTRTRSQSILQRLKRLIQDFPGYQKTLDSLQRSLESRGK